MLPYYVRKDANGEKIDTFLPDSENVLARVLAASTAESITVPDNAKFCTITANGEFYFNTQGTAAVPSADVTDGSASRVVGSGNPVVHILVEDVTTISVIASAARIVTATFWGE